MEKDWLNLQKKKQKNNKSIQVLTGRIWGRLGSSFGAKFRGYFNGYIGGLRVT